VLYHTKSSTPSVEQFQKGYAKSIATAIENDSNEIAILVHDVGVLDGMISDAIGGIASKLREAGAIDIAEIKVFLETEKNISAFKSGVVMASYVTHDLLNMVLSDPRALDVIFIPNSKNELELYLKNNVSTEL
jgi:hypothetical protein